MLNNLRVNLARLSFRVAGVKPTIVRTNKKKDRGYSVRSSKGGLFTEVNRGLKVEYYATHSPFWNLYRIVSRDGNDFVIHEAKRPAKRVVRF